MNVNRHKIPHVLAQIVIIKKDTFHICVSNHHKYQNNLIFDISFFI